MIDIDGSFGEGGGQILRSSLTLALMTSQAFRLRNIRARRSRPGLQPQHLTAVRAAAEVGQAQTRGASVGSSQLEFDPQTVRPGTYRFTIGTAGATTLVLQTVHLPLALQNAPSTVTIEGGTHNDHAPCYHFLDTTWRGHMGRLNLPIDVDIGPARILPARRRSNRRVDPRIWQGRRLPTDGQSAAQSVHRAERRGRFATACYRPPSPAGPRAAGGRRSSR